MKIGNVCRFMWEMTSQSRGSGRGGFHNVAEGTEVMLSSVFGNLNKDALNKKVCGAACTVAVCS